MKKVRWPQLFKTAREKRLLRKAAFLTAPAVTDDNRDFVEAVLKKAGWRDDPFAAPEEAIRCAVQFVSKRSVLIVPRELRKIFERWKGR